MLEKLRSHFLKVGPRRFVIVAVIVLTLFDVVNSYYLKLYWLKKDLSTTLVLQSIGRSGITVEDFSRDTLSEMVGFLNNTFYFFLLVVLANNLFFYFFYLKKKLWAQGYVLFYTLTAALFSITFILDKDTMGFWWTLYNVSTVIVYVYLYFGVKLLKPETTLEGGKKGR
jgi:hypothetical protein